MNSPAAQGRHELDRTRDFLRAEKLDLHALARLKRHEFHGLDASAVSQNSRRLIAGTVEPDGTVFSVADAF